MSLNRLLVLFFFLFCVTPSLPSYGFAPRPKPAPALLMGALGDSITAAFVVRTQSPQASNSTVEVQSLPEVGSPRFPVSILSPVEGRFTESWTTGETIQSHFNLLKAYLLTQGTTQQLKVANFAVTGAPSAKMADQAQHLVDLMNSGDFTALEYVTVLLGANDVCSGPISRDIRKNLMAGFSTLAKIQQSQPIRVLVSSIPRISDLGAPGIAQAKTLFGLSCQQLRDETLRDCPSQTVWSTEAEHQSRLLITDSVNAELQAAVAEGNRTFPNLSIVYSASYSTYHNRPLNLAADCFHPNVLGQSEISQILWADQPWFH